MITLVLAVAAMAGAAPQESPALGPATLGAPWTVLLGEWAGEGSGRPGAV
jgi:hypothetical protein